jgi:protein SCO1/2
MIRSRACAAAVLAVLTLAAIGAMADARPGAAHRATPAAAALLRSTFVYSPGPVTLTRADGPRVALDDELAFDGAVVLNFVFTSCSAVCPIASRTFADLQGKLGRGQRVRLMSISLDPLNDTPQALRAYARKFGAGPDWRFYTGSVEASAAAQRAFELYRGDKMNHAPVTLVRSAPGRTWVRLEGFPSSEQLALELRAPAPAAAAANRPAP